MHVEHVNLQLTVRRWIASRVDQRICGYVCTVKWEV